MFRYDREEMTIHVTRGDVCDIPIMHMFSAGDVIRLKVTKKKDCETVMLQRDFVTEAGMDTYVIALDGEDTKFGNVISKPVDYWYEIELNPDTNPETIVGYDENGPKVFRLYPEGKDVDGDDIEAVGSKTLQELVDYALSEAKASGAFDGVSPAVSVIDMGLGYQVEITDAKGMNTIILRHGTDGESPRVTVTEIEGGHRVNFGSTTSQPPQSFDVMDGKDIDTITPEAIGAVSEEKYSVAETDISNLRSDVNDLLECKDDPKQNPHALTLLPWDGPGVCYDGSQPVEIQIPPMITRDDIYSMISNMIHNNVPYMIDKALGVIENGSY